jgi:anti-sigma B factor antagonist
VIVVELSSSASDPPQTPQEPERMTATGPPETSGGDAVPPQAARPFSCHNAQVDDAAVVAVKGEVDIATAPHLQQAIDSAIESPGARRLVVDLSEVGFFDSGALNVLVRSQNRLASREITLHVVIPPEQHHIRKVFEITRLTGPLGVVEHLSEAIG